LELGGGGKKKKEKRKKKKEKKKSARFQLTKRLLAPFTGHIGLAGQTR